MLTAVLCVVLAAALLAQGAEETTPNPACNDMTLLGCLMAPMMHFMSPAGMVMLQRITNRTGSEAKFIPEDVTMICQVSSTFGQCFEGYTKQCYSSAGNGSNYHEFVNATVQITRELCERPNLYNDGKLAYECLNAMESHDNDSCIDDDAFEDPFYCHNASLLEWQQHQAFFQENDVLGQFCCLADKGKQCARGIIESACSAEARKVVGELVGVFDKAFSCADRVKECSTISQRIRSKSNNCRLPGDGR